MPNPEKNSSERACYRYRTVAIVGPWRRNRWMALQDGVKAGLVRLLKRETQWLVPGEIEESLCDQGGPCGGHPAQG